MITNYDYKLRDLKKVIRSDLPTDDCEELIGILGTIQKTLKKEK